MLQRELPALHQVGHQHCHCHWANSTWNRSDLVATLKTFLIELYIASHQRLFLLCLDEIYTNVHYYGTLLDPTRAYYTWNTASRDYNIGLFHTFFKQIFLRLRETHSDKCIILI